MLSLVYGLNRSSFKLLHKDTKKMIVTNIKALQNALLALDCFTADESNRYAISGILIRANGTSLTLVATDGKVLAHAQLAEIQYQDKQEFILTESTCTWITRLKTNGFNISECILRLSPTSAGHPPIQVMENNIGKGIVAQLSTYTNSKNAPVFPYTEGSFPPFESVIPTIDPTADRTYATLALPMLSKLGKLATIANKNRAKNERSTMYIQTGKTNADPILAQCNGEYGTIYTVVIMQCTTEIAVYETELNNYRKQMGKEIEAREGIQYNERAEQDMERADFDKTLQAQTAAGGINGITRAMGNPILAK